MFLNRFLENFVEILMFLKKKKYIAVININNVFIWKFYSKFR